MLKSIALKDFYLPYDSSQSQIDEVINILKSNDISVYGLGVIYLKTQQDVDNAFNYAQLAGVKMINWIFKSECQRKLNRFLIHETSGTLTLQKLIMM